jgi:hypothetical protein
MGISYNEAKGLIDKGKKRRDGGSTVLESYMPIVIRERKKNKVPMPKPRPKNLKKKDPFRADKTESLNRKFSMETAKANEIKKAMGGLERYEEGGVKKKKTKVGGEVHGLNKPKKKKKKREIKQIKPFMPNIDPRAPEIIRRPAPIIDKSKINPDDFLRKPFMPSVEAEDFDPRMMIRRKKGGAFPDLSGDGEVTQKDILIGRGVIKKKMGGIARGGGAAIQGTKFKGVY